MSYAKRRWVLDLGLQRRNSVNLEAARGSPKLWLVAHIDSKSQTIPMLFRIFGSLLQFLVLVIAASFVIGDAVGISSSASDWRHLTWFAAIVALPTILCWVGNRSVGALDNATGVAAVMLAATSLSEGNSLGVLITSGEELGLAGARAWARTAVPGMMALNCDTIDDVGRWRSMQTSVRAAPLQKIIADTAREMAYDLKTGPLIRGILADSIAFSDAGIASVTLSRGTLSTLARIHTARDTSTALTGKGVAEASRLLSAIGRQFV